MTVYLDYAATAPIRPEVLECYVENMKTLGNPSSVHGAGQTVRRVLEEAREDLAKSIHCDRNEIIFTSGGTESNNLAIKGLFWEQRAKDSNRNVIISAGVEHHAVIDPIDWLVKHEGAEVAWIPVDSSGDLDLDWLENYLKESENTVALISVMWANNEIGVINDIKRVAELAKTYQLPVHSDGVAAFGHIPVNFTESGLSTLAISAHKVGGPIGIGALVVSRATKLVSLVHGGGQERGIRSGTLNAPAAKAFALAAKNTVSELETETLRQSSLRDRIIGEVLAMAPMAKLTGSQTNRLPNNAHFVFEGCSGDSILFLLDQAGVEVSTGAACQAGVNEPSHVLLSMGRSVAEAYGCLRVTLGNDTTEADVDAFLQALPKAVEGALKAGLPNVGAN